MKHTPRYLPVLAIALLSIPGADAQHPKTITVYACAVFDRSSTQTTETRAPLIAGTRISSEFGKRVNPIFGYAEVHLGVDIAAPYGTPIHVTADGVVEEAGEKGTYGNYLLVRHSRTYATGYAHLALGFAPGIHPGVHVRRGQTLGYSGSSGFSSGPHLHYEAWLNGLRVNPNCGCDTTVFRPTIPNSSERLSLLPSVRAPNNH